MSVLLISLSCYSITTQILSSDNSIAVADRYCMMQLQQTYKRSIVKSVPSSSTSSSTYCCSKCTYCSYTNISKFVIAVAIVQPGCANNSRYHAYARQRNTQCYKPIEKRKFVARCPSQAAVPIWMPFEIYYYIQPGIQMQNFI